MLRNSAMVAVVSIATALPCLADDAPKSKRDDSASEKLGIKLSLQCWTFNRLTFFETVDKAAELGVKYLEIFPGQTLKPDSKEKIHRTMSDDTIAAIKQKLTDAGGLKLVAYGVDSVPTDEKGAPRRLSGPKRWASRSLSPRRCPTTSTTSYVRNTTSSTRCTIIRRAGRPTRC